MITRYSVLREFSYTIHNGVLLLIFKNVTFRLDSDTICHMLFSKVSFSYTDVLFFSLKSHFKSLRLIRDLNTLLTKDVI